MLGDGLTADRKVYSSFVVQDSPCDIPTRLCPAVASYNGVVVDI
jgi:hypothetical protein